MERNEMAKDISPFRVRRFDDDVYRWIYELEVLGISVAIIIAISLIILLATGQFSLQFDPDELKVIGGVVLVFVAITVLSYFIVAKQYGGKYIVIFEMTEESITHRQMESQFDKAKAMGWWTTIIGLAAGSLTTAGAGLMSATRNSMVSEYASVRKIKPNKRMHLIHVNGLLERNQIYVCEEDFEFVLQFHYTHCKK